MLVLLIDPSSPAKGQNGVAQSNAVLPHPLLELLLSSFQRPELLATARFRRQCCHRLAAPACSSTRCCPGPRGFLRGRRLLLFCVLRVKFFRRLLFGCLAAACYDHFEGGGFYLSASTASTVFFRLSHLPASDCSSAPPRPAAVAREAASTASASASSSALLDFSFCLPVARKTALRSRGAVCTAGAGSGQRSFCAVREKARICLWGRRLTGIYGAGLVWAGAEPRWCWVSGRDRQLPRTTSTRRTRRDAEVLWLVRGSGRDRQLPRTTSTRRDAEGLG